MSSLAIHNIGSAGGRAAAIEEAVSVLKPCGRLAIADIRFAREYMRGSEARPERCEGEEPWAALLVRRPVDGDEAGQRRRATLRPRRG